MIDKIFVDGILSGRVAFVTGGGTGITGGVARALAEAGANVALVSRSLEHLEPAAKAINDARVERGSNPLGSSPTVREERGSSPAVREERGSSPTVREERGSSPTVREERGSSPTVREKRGSSPTVREGLGGGEAFAIASDVRNPEQVDKAIADTIARFGKIDIVVNGAAGNFLSPAEALSPNGFGTVVDIDLKGTFNVCRAAFAQLKEHQGQILNISATLHYLGTPMQLHVSAAKAGVDALTRNLAVEWGRYGIRVNGIAPGPIADTEGMKRLVPEALKEKLKKNIPLGRFGRISDIEKAAVFLCSDAASFINGAILVVDGGQWLSAARMV